jgi:hypothetical protein
MCKSLLVVFLILSSISFGQLHSVGFHAGAMGTGVGSSFSNGESKPKVDFTAGLNYQYRFTTHLTLGGNLEYTQFGAQIPVEYEDNSDNIVTSEYASWDWNYVSIPLIIGYEMGGAISFKPKVALVPSILNRAFYNFKSYPNTTLAPYKDSYYSQANKFDLAGMIGIDLAARFHSGVIFLGLDLRYSLTKLNTDSFFSTTLFDPMRNKSISSYLGVRFNIGKPEEEALKDIIDAPIK